MAGGAVGYATLPVIPSFQGFGTNLAAQIGGPLGSAATSAGDAAGKKSGGAFSGAFGKYLGAAALVAGTVAAFAGLYKIGGIYDDVSDTIRIGTGATGDALDGLTTSARKVSTLVPAALGDIGTAVADINTRLGYSGPVLETFTAQVLELGQMQGAAVNVNDLSASLSGFRVPASGANAALDDLFRVSQATGVPVNKLTASLKDQGGVLGQLGFSLTESASLLGVLDKAGVNGTAVVRSLSMGMVRLAKDGEAPADAFDRVIGELDGFIASGNSAAALDLAGKVFGTRGAAQFISALQSGKINLDDLRSSANLTGDSIMEVARETRDFPENFALIKNKGLDLLQPIATRLFDTFNVGFGKLTDLVLALPPLDQIFGPAVVAGGQIFAGVMQVLSPAFEILLAAVGPLIPQLVALWSTASPIVVLFQALQPLLPQIATLLATIASVFAGALAAILPTIVGLITTLASVLSSVLAVVLPVVVMLLQALVPVFSSVVQAIMPVVVTLLEVATAILSFLLPVLAQIIAFLVPILIPIFQVLGVIVVAVFTAIGAIATWLWTVILQPVFTAIGAIVNWVWQSVIQPVVNFIVGYFQLLGLGVRVVWTTFIKPALDAIGVAFNWLWNNVINPVGKFISSAIGAVGSTIRSVFGGISGFIGAAFRSVLGVVRGPINALIDLINGIIGGLNSIRVTIPSWVPLVGGNTFGVNIPRIPRLALGADVLARPGGTLAVLGEGGQAETVTNLGTTNRALEAATELAERALGEGAGGVRDLTLIVHNPIGEPTEESIRSNAQLIGAGLSV